ncbi:MAG TPA: tetraacyldisaccharide 4'-kinase [Tepidisphaeraceae bacterium]|nr:tetraacyldisaccharide 4'-kinase [Tepidisphaeraceae bacterium]
MSGSATGTRAVTLRVALAACEPFYCSAVRLRNRLFDLGLRKVHRVPVPVVSIGNITAGGTGKTPMAEWLADRLRRAGRRPAILSRGYGARAGELGDELTMLDQHLNRGAERPIPVRANPDRVAATRALLDEHREIDFILLDDGFQHRRIGRDLDIVLISAVNPFGFDHVLPRGLLREPLSGLRRAGTIVITHAESVDAHELGQIERRLRDHAPGIPLYRAAHRQAGLREGGTDHPIEKLSLGKYFIFSGIANPQVFERQLARVAAPLGSGSFPDHHQYTLAELLSIERDARAAGAQVLVTTEKDWVKIEPFAGSIELPIWRAQMRIEFFDDDEKRILGQVSALSSKP